MAPDKTHEPTEDVAGHRRSLERRVRRACQWMVEAHDWQNCGKTATHVHRGSRMVFCAGHGAVVARFLGNTDEIENA